MLDPAFTLLGTPVTWLEAVAFALALGCVLLCVLESHWNWPLAIASSTLYAWVFAESGLYGEAGLQGVFVVLSAWGWWQWLTGRRRLALTEAGQGGGATEVEAPLRIATMGRRLPWLFVAWGLLWPAIGLLLAHTTDSDVPYLDAFATSGSVVAQVLMGRKLLENWPLWVVVDVFSIGLFAYKGLMLTAVLYAVFGVLAVVGWIRWRRLIVDAAAWSDRAAAADAAHLAPAATRPAA